ncbi:MAG: hypothetical protein HONBIEJF_02711 [Fimbriimonadaceae bacterium]|nr:hypothetical protein [Fimbriimonadaceae bacterium]
MLCLVGLSAVPARAQSISLPGYFVEEYAPGSSAPNAFEFISPTEFYILEKNSGHVNYFRNRTFNKVALNLAVANQTERGLLGIAKDPNFATNSFIYLFYSAATTDGGAWIENRVQRCTMMANKDLVLGPILFTIPNDPLQNNGPNHDGGYIRIGPDGKLYIQTGDLNRGQFANPRIEMNTSTSAVAGCGGLYRINLDGSIPADNPFISHSDPKIQALWAYGIRNAYGMDWDPLTGKLWFSENGPNGYDELNIAERGMNSGWVKIMGPDSRSFKYGENGNTDWNAGQLTILPGSQYRDPEFSWLSVIAPTGVVFPYTLKVYPAERQTLWVGDFINGAVYRFPLTAFRDGIAYMPGTEDRVADNLTERNQYRIATGFAETIDMRIGPEGYIYISSEFLSRVFRIRPLDEECGPSAMTVSRGRQLGGSLGSLSFSDESKLLVGQGVSIVPPGTDPTTEVEFITTSPDTTPTGLRVFLETSVARANAEQSLALYDFVGNDWETIDTRTIGSSDTFLEASAPGDVTRFVRAVDAAIKWRLRYRTVGGQNGRYQVSLDQSTVSVKL